MFFIGFSNLFRFIIVYRSMESFEEIWKEYYPKLTVYLRTSFHFEDTDDLVQDIMMKMHANLHKYNSKWSFSTWIFSIARNHAIDSLKKNTSRLRTVETLKHEAEIYSSASSSAETILLKNELQTDIAFFISSLPETERQVAFLKYHAEMNYKEISRITGSPEGTIKYHVHNIKNKFAQYYGENYED